jgi:hypothetical protein
VTASSTWWGEAWDFFSVAPLLRICRSPLWRAAVLAATQAHIRPETLMRFHIGQLIGLVRLGSAHQACWAIQTLIYSLPGTHPRSSFNTHRLYRVHLHQYRSMRDALNVANGVAPVWARLLAVDDESPESTRLRYAAARLLFILAIPDADRDELASMGGPAAGKLINEHGRRVDLPLPPPLVRPDEPEMLRFGVDQLVWATMRLSVREVFGLPDDARMYVYLNGEPVNKPASNQSSMAIQCAVEWTPDQANGDLLGVLDGWRVKLPRDDAMSKVLCFARRSDRLRVSKK